MEEKKTTLRLDADNWKKIKMFCLEQDITFNQFAVDSMIYCANKKIVGKHTN